MSEAAYGSRPLGLHEPSLVRAEHAGIAWWTDATLRAEHGVTIAFTERNGGVSSVPFASLNLASHVGDEPGSVDENRRRALAAIGCAHGDDPLDRLTVPMQVHGRNIAVVDRPIVGRGGRASRGDAVPDTDALITRVAGVPLLLCFADCVPVVLVAPGPVVAVVHAGWRGALASLPGFAAVRLAHEAGCEPFELLAYVGPHIRACHYGVDEQLLSHFIDAFGTVARADSGGLDLEAVVFASLANVGVARARIVSQGACTAEETSCFFSHRAEHALTGRHAALACIDSW